MTDSRNGRTTALVALALSISMVVPTVAVAAGPTGANGVAAAVPGAAAAAWMAAKKKKGSSSSGLTPEAAEPKREAIRSAVADDVDNERWEAAADKTESNAAQLGDPLSFRDAANHRLEQAKVERDIDTANAAIETANIALDILHYYDAVAGGEVESEWQPIDPSSASSMISEVEGIIERAESLITEIEAEQAASGSGSAAGPADNGKKKRQKRERKPGRPGTVLIALGAAFTGIGVAGVSLVVAGTVISAGKQKEVEKLTLPMDQAEVERLDDEGSKANNLAYIGAGVAVVGLAVGVPLIVVGVMRRKKGNPGAAAQLRVAPAISRSFGGVALHGRF